MSKPVTESAFVAAWPGSGLPKTTQSRNAQGAKTSDRDDPRDPTSRTRAARSSPRDPQGHDGPGRARARRLVAGERGQPDEGAQADEPRIQVTRAPRGSRASRVISRHAPRASAANGIVESGSAEWSSSGR